MKPINTHLIRGFTFTVPVIVLYSISLAIDQTLIDLGQLPDWIFLAVIPILSNTKNSTHPSPHIGVLDECDWDRIFWGNHRWVDTRILRILIVSKSEHKTSSPSGCNGVYCRPFDCCSRNLCSYELHGIDSNFVVH